MFEVFLLVYYDEGIWVLQGVHVNWLGIIVAVHSHRLGIRTGHFRWSESLLVSLSLHESEGLRGV